MPKPVCHDTPDYFVITRERDGEAGKDIIVRAKLKATTKIACKYTVKPKDIVLGKGESQDFLAMHGRFLALDEGTGPDRRLAVVDVTIGKTLVHVPYAERGAIDAKPDGFTYWVVGDQPVKVATCPAPWLANPENKDAKSAHSIHETRFIFADAVVRETGAVDCTQTQDDM